MRVVASATVSARRGWAPIPRYADSTTLNYRHKADNRPQSCGWAVSQGAAFTCVDRIKLAGVVSPRLHHVWVVGPCSTHRASDVAEVHKQLAEWLRMMHGENAPVLAVVSCEAGESPAGTVCR